MPTPFAEYWARKSGISPGDHAHCAELLRRGSKSFHAASLLLPPRLVPAITAFYAYCRIADDAIDEVPAHERATALRTLHARLDAVYAGAPPDEPVYRALGAIVRTYALPRGLLDALLEGFAWDVDGRRYETLSDIHAYAARVASAVGVVMTLLMGRRAPLTLARAADLGVAMQLTNIARDVGEDARNGRVYLPLEWLREAGLDADALLAAPRFSPALGVLVARLLDHAQTLYDRAELGIDELPWDCRLAIRAAGLLYADIGRELRAAGCDSVSARRSTTRARKAVLLVRAAQRSLPLRRNAANTAPPLPETAFLVEAVAP